MVNKKDTLEIAKDIFLKGDEKLKSAKVLLENQLFDDSVSRIYYGVFYFTRSLLYLLGDDPYTHKGILALFGLKIIKTGLMEKKFGKILSNLLEKRARGDYEIYSFLDATTTENLLKDAMVFRDEIKKVLKDKFNLEI